MHFALRYALDKKININFAGSIFDPITVESLRGEPDLYPHNLLMKALNRTNAITSTWTSNYNDFINSLHVRGGEAFAESMDRSKINFLVALLSKAAPKQKKILVDERDIRIFRDLYDSKENNIVAVINQWHMQGVETHWRRSTGTEVVEPQLSPIADMNIDLIQEKTLINDWLRNYVSTVSKSEPATWQDYQTNYHK
jgi:pheromone shutdown protein TraB